MIFARPHLRNPAAPQHTSRSRGSAVVFMILLMGVLIAGMVSSMGMLSGIQSQSAGVDLKRNAAFYAAEAGLQQAVWNMNSSPANWLAQCPYSAQLANGCTYTIFVVGTANWPTTPVTFRSVGLSADSSVSTQASITVTNTVLAPGLAVGGNMADNGTLIINGSVEVVGSITRNGTMTQTNVTGLPPSSLEAMGSFTSNGTFTVPANVLMNGSITSNGSVTAGGIAQAGSSITENGTWAIAGGSTSLSSPNLSYTAPTVDTAGLIAKAQANGTMMFGGNLSSPTFDFTASPNGIIYINGNTSINGTIKTKGTGTLIIKGTLTLNGNIGSVGPPPVLAPMNLVTTSDVTFNGSINLNGALCVGGIYTKNGTTNINGVLVVQSNLVSNGAVTLTYAQAPSFIQYTGGGGSGANIQVTNFSGATY